MNANAINVPYVGGMSTGSIEDTVFSRRGGGAGAVLARAGAHDGTGRALGGEPGGGGVGRVDEDVHIFLCFYYN